MQVKLNNLDFYYSFIPIKYIKRLEEMLVSVLILLSTHPRGICFDLMLLIDSYYD